MVAQRANRKGRAPTRRDVLRFIAFAAAGGIARGLGARARGQVVVRSRVLMGTHIHLTVLAADREAGEAAALATLERMAALEAQLSRYRPQSEVSRLHASGRLEVASDALLDVLRLADRVWRLGDGAFDLTVQPVLDLHRAALGAAAAGPAPAAIEQALARVDQRAVRVDGRSVSLSNSNVRLTLDGIGKGYIVDRGIEVMRAHGFTDVFVEAGGDLVARGTRAAGVPWRIGIRNPRRGLALQARFSASDRAVATSGDYVQSFTPDHAQHHIIDPRTGYSAPELASSTVIAPDAATADALATLTMVLGSRRGRALLEDLSGCEGYFVSKQLEVTRTSGFEAA